MPAEPVLIRLLADSSLEVRRATAIALCRLGSVSGEAALERFAVSESAAERRLAAVAMAELGEESFLPPLLHMLDDRDNSVSQEASRSLSSIAGDDGPSLAAEMHFGEVREAWKSWAAGRRD